MIVLHPAAVLLSGAALLAGLAGPRPAAAKEAAPPTLQQALGNPANLTINGTVRLRHEVLDGQFRPGFNATDELWSIRSTLFVELDTGVLRIGGELYDSRAYGSKPGGFLTTSEVNAVEPVQAYLAADFENPFGKGSKLNLQAGRFMFNLGSRRLIAADDYRNTTNGYTGIRADLRLPDRTSLTMHYTLPQQRLPDRLADLSANRVELDREGLSQQLYGALLAHPLGRRVTGELGYVGFAESDRPGRPTRDRQLHSLTARAIAEPAAGKADWEIEGIYQFGTLSADLAAAAPQLQARAWFVHADAGYTFPGRWKVRLSVEYDRASGDGPGPTYTRFDTLFGMRRAELSPAGIYAAIGRTNLETIGLRLEATPSRRIDFFLESRALWAASATDSFSTTGVRDPSGRSGRFAGYQLEGRLRYWIVPRLLRAELNGALLVKRGLLRNAPNAPRLGDTRYLSSALTVSF